MQLFAIQPAKRQWENLADSIDRCFVLADRPDGKIYVCWYAHTKTKRMAGICISPTQSVVDNNKTWKKAIEWAIADFGFRNCPIFQVEILQANPETGVQLSKLRCYTKTKDTKTILAPCRRPVQVYKDAPNPTILLPATDRIEWEWRRTKCTHAIGVEKPRYKLQELPEIADRRTISLLSTPKRVRRMLELAEETQTANWKRKTESILVVLQK